MKDVHKDSVEVSAEVDGAVYVAFREKNGNHSSMEFTPKQARKFRKMLKRALRDLDAR
jgi:hypothetical protein